MRGNEGKDGNPHNEVRLLAASILADDGVLSGDRSIRYLAARSVSGLDVGEPIVLDLATLRRLCDAFIEELGRRYGD